MFSMASVPRNYKRAQSEELEQYEEYNGVVQLEVRIVPVECPVRR
jgi:hypothetical protein